MATISDSAPATAKTPSCQVYKFAGFNCKTADEVTDAINAQGAKYAIVFAKEAGHSGNGSTTCEIIMQAQSLDGVWCSYRWYHGRNVTNAASAGDVISQTDVLAATGTTSNRVQIGRVVHAVPRVFRLNCEVANDATSLTLDIFVEVHY